jgi:two-component system phosphate regulon response regulator PhoB
MKKILIIEDDVKICAALRVRLGAAGYEIAAAQDGFSGLKMTMTFKPDLILLDIMMPVGMGFSVAERLKDLGLSEIPIIFITASKRAGLRKMAERLGAAGFFEKPYDADELVAAIDLILDHKQKMVIPKPASRAERASGQDAS